MTARKAPFNADELARTFGGAWGEKYPPVLSPAQFAGLIGLSPKTIYEWIAKGRLAGAARRRGKHVFIWRDRALENLFSGPEWTND